MSETVLSGEGVTKRFGGLTAVDDVDFHVESGEIVGLIGPNGAGKSTLFDCITGALPADEGRVHLADTEISTLDEYEVAQRGVQRLFQEVRVYDDMTLRENLLVSADHSEESVVDVFQRYPEDVRSEAADLLEYVELADMSEEPAGDLSYGQQKLLEFAMLLMADPDVLLLDEPASGINPTMVEKMLAYIRDVNAEREKTLFVIEHNMDFIMDISDRMYVMSDGDVIKEGSPDEVRESQRVKDAYLGGQ